MSLITNKNRYTDMTDGPVIKTFVLFIIPLILTNLLQQFYNIADSMIVGKFAGSDALAAVGVCGTIYAMLVSLFGGLAGGSSVVVAQKFGAKDYKAMSDAVHTSYAVAIAGGAVLTIVGLVSMRSVFEMMKTPKEIIDDATCYMTYIYIGIIPAMIYNFGSGILRSVGDSRNPLIFLLVATVTNITLNLVFVAVFKMGVAGVGLSTLISQIISAVLVTVVLCRTHDMHKLVLKKIRFHKETVLKVLAIGIPSGIQSSMFAVSNMIIKTYINQFGVTVIAADAVEGNISNIAFTISGAFTSAMVTFSGQNYGKKLYDRLYKGSIKCFGLCFGVVTSMCVIAMIFSGQLPYLFTNDAEVAAVAQTRSLILLPLIGLYSAAETAASAIRGCGKSLVTMIVSVVCICAVRILWITIGLTVSHSVETIYASYPASYVVYFLAIMLYYVVFKKYWLGEKAIKER